MLLHRGADSLPLTGFHERGFPGEPFDVALRYRVVHVWQVPAAECHEFPPNSLSGGTNPMRHLAPLLFVMALLSGPTAGLHPREPAPVVDIPAVTFSQSADK